MLSEEEALARNGHETLRTQHKSMEKTYKSIKNNQKTRTMIQKTSKIIKNHEKDIKIHRLFSYTFDCQASYLRDARSRLLASGMPIRQQIESSEGIWLERACQNDVGQLVFYFVHTKTCLGWISY